jgi:hypothetical protein
MHGGEMWSWVKSFDKTGKGQAAGKDAVNWDERRERVKDAFLVSWEGYEKDAWGEELTLSFPASALIFYSRRLYRFMLMVDFCRR